MRQVASVELADAESIGALVKRVADVAKRAAGKGAYTPDAAAPTVLVASNINARARKDARANVQAD